jgi:hypothetical protein
MLTSFSFAIFLLDGPSWWTRVEPYLDYPGFEAWKFLNLAVFVGVMVYILTRKANLGEAFRARRENIKQELARAQQERDPEADRDAQRWRQGETLRAVGDLSSV